MSRIGRMPINIPEGVKIEVKNEEGIINVKGKKGEVSVSFEPSMVSVMCENNTVRVVPRGSEKEHKARWGLYRQLINNAITGVTQGFEKRLEVNGVGYTASVSGRILSLSLGFTHGVVFILPEEVKCEVLQEKGKGIIIKLSSHDKYLLGEVAARIRALRPVNVYSGKGIKYVDEEVIRKEGKKAKR